MISSPQMGYRHITSVWSVDTIPLYHLDYIIPLKLFMFMVCMLIYVRLAKFAGGRTTYILFVIHVDYNGAH